MSEPCGYCMSCKASATRQAPGLVFIDHKPGCELALRTGETTRIERVRTSDRCPWCEGSGYRSAHGPLQHLVLSWAARGLLTMSEGWRDRRVLMSSKPVNEATDKAADALHDQGLIKVADYGTIMCAAGTIAMTDEGRIQLDQWDRLAAGVQ